MKENIFAIINLGSQHITGMLASRLSNGRINPKTYHSVNSQGIIHGYIHNIAEVSASVAHLIDLLRREFAEGELKRVYVGVDVQSMRSHTFRADLSFGEEGIILDLDHIKKLQEQAYNKVYPGQSVLHVTEPIYFVDGKKEINPRGVRCRHIQADYQLITIRRDIERNIYEVFEQRLGYEVAEILVAPIAEAKVCLTKQELMLGCAYINIGAGTTSISLYEGRVLKALYVLPLGGDNVTRDLTKLKLLEGDAEQLKLRHGSMDIDIDPKQSITAPNINGNGVKTLSLNEVNRYIHARMLEITSNVLALIHEIDPSAPLYVLVLSGGGALVKGYIDTYLPSQELGEEAIRYATARPDVVHESVASPSFLTQYHTLIGLATMATVNCIEYPVASLETLLDEVDKVEENTQPAEKPTEEPITKEEEGHTYNWDEVSTSTDADNVEEEEEDEDEEEEDGEEEEDNKKTTSLGKMVANLSSKIGLWLEDKLGGKNNEN